MDAKIRELILESIDKEWDAFLQYAVHAAMLQSMHQEDLVDHLLSHAEDEKGHAMRLTTHMLSRGIAFPVKVNHDFQEEEVAGDMIHMLAEDLAGETEAIERYIKIIEACGDDTDLQSTRLLIEDIVTTEIEHQDDISTTMMSKTDKKIKGTSPESLAKEASVFVPKLMKVADHLDELGMTDEADVIDSICRKYVDI